jgi:hypothetical protein
LRWGANAAQCPRQQDVLGQRRILAEGINVR